MKLRFYAGPAILLALAFSATAQTSSDNLATTGQVPRLVRFSGVAVDEWNKPQSGVVGITFALYKEQQGGAPLWLETQNVAADGAGHYSAMLGATKPEGIPLELFASGEAQWLGVRISDQTEQPRVLLLSVPYALKAADAETIGGMPPSAFMMAHSAQTPATAGTVTSVGLAAPTTDFSVSGSPVTTAGTLTLAWKISPTNVDAASAIVKRDTSGNFSAGTITATGFSGDGSALTNVNAASLGGVAPGGYANLGLADTFAQPLTIKATASTSPLLTIEGSGTGAGTFSIDGYGDLTLQPGTNSRPVNLVPGVGTITTTGSWSNFSAIDLIPGSALNPIASSQTVFRIGFTGGTTAVIGNMVLYTTARASTKITAVTAVKYKGVSNPTISLTNTGTCPLQPLATAKPCIVKLDPVTLTMSPLDDYYLVLYFANNSNNGPVGAATSYSLIPSMNGVFQSGDDTHIGVGGAVPLVPTGSPYFLMAVTSN
jgi:trimeric autotransporter adhesin